MKIDDHPILNRVQQVSKAYVDGLDPDKIPTDPQKFLDWWWDVYGKNCQSCFLSESRTTVVKPDGLASANVMVIGEGPGFLEDLSGVPLVGPAELRGSRCRMCSQHPDCYGNRYLQNPNDWGKKAKLVTCKPQMRPNKQMRHNFYLRSAGSVVDGIIKTKWNYKYPRHNWIVQYNENNPNDPWTHESPWFMTNAVLCRSTDSTGIKDQTPSSVSVTMCKRNLAMQWAAVNPKIVVCLGRAAMGTVMGNMKSASSAIPNQIYESKKFGRVIFQNHPAYFMREKSKQVKALGYAKIASTLEKGLDLAGYLDGE